MSESDLPPRKTYKVGIPRAFSFYKFFPLWKTLLEELGTEIVLSSPTNKKIVEEGCAMGFGELCLPMKVYYGHFLNLIREHPDLDFVFVPRYVSTRIDSYYCPKFLSLPDVVRIIPNAPPLLVWEVNIKEKPEVLTVTELGAQLGRGSQESIAAYEKACKAFKSFHTAVRAGLYFGDALKRVEKGIPLRVVPQKGIPSVRLLLLGHGYNIFDTFVNLDFYHKLCKQGAVVTTLESLPEKVFAKPVIINGALRNYWTHEEEILSAARYFLYEGREEIDGVIFLISFACGPDSLISELIMRDMKVVNIPFLALIIDEHSGEAGMLTRIESFVEMIKRKKRAAAAAITTEESPAITNEHHVEMESF